MSGRVSFGIKLDHGGVTAAADRQRPALRRPGTQRDGLDMIGKIIDLAGYVHMRQAPALFQPRPPSPSASWPLSVTITVSSSLMKPRLGCDIVVSIDSTMPLSSGRSLS